MKKTKKNYLIIALVIILLVLAVGYAAFSGTLTITGTATANGTWDVHFANASVTPTEGNTATINTTGASDTLTVSVNLAYPGDGATVAVDIVNEGTIDAKLTGFTVTGTGSTSFSQSENVYQDDAIKVTVPEMTTGEVVAGTDGVCHFKFDVEWDETVTEVDEGGQTATFEITFDYEQSTQSFTPGVSHTDG